MDVFITVLIWTIGILTGIVVAPFVIVAAMIVVIIALYCLIYLGLFLFSSVISIYYSVRCKWYRRKLAKKLRVDCMETMRNSENYFDKVMI